VVWVRERYRRGTAWSRPHADRGMALRFGKASAVLGRRSLAWTGPFPEVARTVCLSWAIEADPAVLGN